MSPSFIAQARAARTLKFGLGSDWLTSQGTCLDALASIPSDVSIDGLNCGEGGSSGPSAPTCPTDVTTAAQYLGGAMSQAVSSGDASSVAQATCVASAELFAQFVAAGSSCLAQVGPFYYQLGQDVQMLAGQGCINGTAGDELAQATALAPQVMASTVLSQINQLTSVEQAIAVAAQACVPSIEFGFQTLISQCK